MKHTKPATLCRDCERDLIATAETSRPPFLVAYCPHRRTLAAVRIEQGIIKDWTLEGPMTVQQAKEIAGEGLRQGQARAARETATTWH